MGMRRLKLSKENNTDTAITELQESILTPEKLSKIVEEYVTKYRMRYTEAVVAICEDRGIDPEDIGKSVPKNVVNKIEAEAIESRILKGGNALPI